MFADCKINIKLFSDNSGKLFVVNVDGGDDEYSSAGLNNSYQVSVIR
jgi:hypothetical protein